MLNIKILGLGCYNCYAVEQVAVTAAQGSLADRAQKELRANRKRYGGRMPQPIYPGDLDERQRAN